MFSMLGQGLAMMASIGLVAQHYWKLLGFWLLGKRMERGSHRSKGAWQLWRPFWPSDVHPGNEDEGTQQWKDGHDFCTWDLRCRNGDWQRCHPAVWFLSRVQFMNLIRFLQYNSNLVLCLAFFIDYIACRAQCSIFSCPCNKCKRARVFPKFQPANDP